MSNPPAKNAEDPIGKPLVAAKLPAIGRQIEASLAPLGLQLEPKFGSWKFSGEVDGRPVTGTIATRSRSQYISRSISYRKFTGLWLDMAVTTSVMSRFSVSQPPRWIRGFTGFMQRLIGKVQVLNLGSNYDSFSVYAHDPEWAEGFFATTAVQSHLFPLVQNPDLPHGGALVLSPGKLQWTSPAMPASFTPEGAESWLRNLLALAAQLERHPPVTAVQPNWVERQNPTHVAFGIAIAFLFGIPLLLFLCCMLPALTLILLNSN